MKRTRGTVVKGHIIRKAESSWSRSFHMTFQKKSHKCTKVRPASPSRLKQGELGVLATKQICLLPLTVSSVEPTRVWVRGNSDAQSQKEKLGCPVRLSQSTE